MVIKVMEKMKVSSIVKAYPNSFVLAYADKRDSSGRVLLASVMGVYTTKEEAIVQQTLYKILGVKTFLIPTINESEKALSIKITGENYEVEPLLSPSEYAKIFRDYYDFS